jgi:BirA family biotin operon repressor/biotin-[acetyl-CoA-carboxylase] ligase
VNRIKFFETTSSTQDEARNWLKANKGEKEFLWFHSQKQSAGRGRQGREWVDSGKNELIKSSLLVSVGMPFASFEKNNPPVNWSLLPLVSGWVLWSTVCKIIKSTNSSVELSFEDLLLKWPNDLGIIGPAGGFRKMAGILCERFGAQAPEHIVGWGVNIKPHGSKLDSPLLFFSEFFDHTPPETSFVLGELMENFEATLQKWKSNPEDFELCFLEDLKETAMKQYWGIEGFTSNHEKCKAIDLDDAGNLIVESFARPGTILTLRAGEFQLSNGLSKSSKLTKSNLQSS